MLVRIVARWDEAETSEKRKVRVWGFAIWALCLIVGILLGLATDYFLPVGQSRDIAGIGSVILAGGALGFMGLYLGFELSVLSRRALRRLFSGSKR